MATTVRTQYTTAAPLLGALPSFVADKEEQQRLASYDLYMDMYWNAPGAFKLVSRGAEDKPIYIPAAKTIVETLNRYVAPGMTMIPDTTFIVQDTNAQLLATQVYEDFARREVLRSKFAMMKRFSLVRGDSMFYLHGDPIKPETTRVGITVLDPGRVFAVTLPDDVNEVVGYDVVDLYDDNGTQLIRRQTWTKATMLPGPSAIVFTDELYEVNDWGGPGTNRDEAKLVRTLNPPVTLPSPIDHLPIYHFPNFQEPGQLWGSSELRGMERIVSAIGQSISDEELSLALDGLGLYATDAGSPLDENGQETPWNLGPGRVVELPLGTTMKRISGTSSVTPYQDHLKYLHGQIAESTAMSAVAVGRVDVQVAESGVALALELAPLLARAEEKDDIISDKMTQLFYDLAKWYVAYEGSAFGSLIENVRMVPSYREKMPRNKEKEVTELMALKATGIVSAAYVRERLRSLGFEDMPDETTMAAAILQETQNNALITQDAQGQRVDQAVEQELGAQTSTGA